MQNGTVNTAIKFQNCLPAVGGVLMIESRGEKMKRQLRESVRA